MEIVKQLNLNGNPQTVPNGSLVFAKNIRLSADGTYITNDDGFNTPYDNTEDSENLRKRLKVDNVSGVKVNNFYRYEETLYESIDGVDTEIIREYDNDFNFVGNINCPNEIVLFITNHYKDYFLEGGEMPEEPSRIGYISEIYRLVEFKDIYKFALFRIPNAWNYDGGKIVGTFTYNIYGHLIIAIGESEGSTDKQLITIDLNDCSEEDSIDKYSCAPKIPIANLYLINKVKGKPIPHGLYSFFIRYEISEKLYTDWFPIGAPQYALSLDYKTLFNHAYKGTNGSSESTYYTYISKLVNTEKDSYYNFNFNLKFNKTYGYIGFQIAYILQTDNSSIGRIWNNFKLNNEELSKDILFNGGSIEEIDIEDLTKNVLNIYNVKTLTKFNNKLYAANFKETEYNVHINLNDYVDRIDTYVVKKLVDITKVKQESSTLVTWTYNIKAISGGTTSCSITVPEEITKVKLTEVNRLVEALSGAMRWHTNNNQNILYWLGTNATLNLNEDLLSIEAEDGSRGVWSYYDDYRYDIWARDAMVLISTYYYDHVEITKTKATTYYESSNDNNVIRSLMPFEVYAFYVHYVREDGSYTNGFLLKNKRPLRYGYPTEDKLKTQIKDLTAEDKQTYGLTDIATIPEIANRYLYEVYYSFNDYGKYYFDVYYDANGNALFKTSIGCGTISNPLSERHITRLGIQFTNIIIPNGYKGVFFSYEKVNSLSVYQGYVAETVTGNNVLIKGNDVELSLCNHNGSIFIPHHVNGSTQLITTPYTFISESVPVLSNAKTTINNTPIDNTGKHGGVLMHLKSSNSQDYVPTVGVVGSILILNRSIYSNETKELIPFGPIVYKTTGSVVYGESSVRLNDDIDPTDININYDMNYPSFICEDKILIYKEKIIPNEELNLNIIAGNVVSDNLYNQNNYAEVKDVWKFSNYNLLALTFKKAPEEATGIVEGNTISVNTLVKPVNASDLFKLESCYIPQIHKAYTNYNKNIETINKFTNVIRCSYPIRNESSINSWRIFRPENYHVIDNANGEIVNIFGSGTSFFVHTRNNLLVTSSNAKITADNTTIHLQDNKIFDVPPAEIFSSDLGYGGLKYQECQMFSQLGYIWYDSDRNKLFRFDNGNLVDISADIETIIKYNKFEYCIINIDNYSDRVFFCFYDYNKQNILTLGYSILTNKWISIYDYKFDLSVHTVNRALFVEKENNYVLIYDETESCCAYNALRSYNSLFPSYTGITHTGPYCCFDIIFNEAYTVPKTLESISWIHEILKDNLIGSVYPNQYLLDNPHIEKLKFLQTNILDKYKDLDDLSVIIYSDSVDTGLIPLACAKLNDVANPANPNAYKLPYYNKGVWNLSYFRDKVMTPVTEEELTTLAEQYHISPEKLKNIFKVEDRNGVISYRISDNRSLVYGKYIVVRFVFMTSKRIKFDNLVFNIKQY